MPNQLLVNEVVEAVLNGEVTEELEDRYVSSSSVYDDEFSESTTSEIAWLPDTDAFERSELHHWDAYFDRSYMEKIGIGDKTANDWLKGKEISDGDYKIFLRHWIRESFHEFDWSVHPIASVHRIFHSDGRSIYVLIACSEPGQGGFEFPNVFKGFYRTLHEAIAYLKNNGLINKHTEDEIQEYIMRAVRL